MRARKNACGQGMGQRNGQDLYPAFAKKVRKPFDKIADPGSFPRRTLGAISHPDTLLTKISLSGSAIRARACSKRSGSFWSHQRRT